MLIRSVASALAALLAVALASCGSGGGGGASSPGPTAISGVLPAAASSTTGTIALSVTIPSPSMIASSSSARSPEYISANATDFYVVLASLNSVSQTAAGGFVYAQDLSTSTPGACSGSGTSRVCSWTLANVPAGTAVMEILQTKTTTNVASPLGYALSGSIVVTSGGTASANVTLAGIVNSAALSAGVLNGLLQLGVSTSLTDASGNAVTGTFANPIAVTSTGNLLGVILNGASGANNVQITKSTDALSIGAIIGTLSLTATPATFTTPLEYARDFSGTTFNNAGGSSSTAFGLTCLLNLGCSSAGSGSLNLGVN